LPAAQLQADAYAASLIATRHRSVSDTTTARQNQCLEAFHRDVTTYKGLATLQSPLLVTQGLLDTIEPPVNAQIIVDASPLGTRLEYFSGAGHAMHFQETTRFCNLVREFLG
jgi:pimeloyl-ACP methyl ester carboxylesterase